MLSSINTRIYQTRKNKASHHQNAYFYMSFVESYPDRFAMGSFCPLLLNFQKRFRGIARVACVEKKTKSEVFIPNFPILKRHMDKNLEVNQRQTQIKNLIKGLGIKSAGVRQRGKEEGGLTKINRSPYHPNNFQKEVTIKTQIIRGNALEVINSKVFSLNASGPDIYKKVKCFIALKGFISKLLKGNSYCIKQMRPYLYSDLKGFSTTAGFKKALYNKVSMQDRRLQPGTNRRKHNHSHYLIITNQFRRIKKTFHYVGKQNFSNIVAFVLKTAYFFKPVKSICFIFNSAPLPSIRAIPYLVSTIETQIMVLLWRNQFRCHLTNSKQALLHQNTKQNMYSLYPCPSQRSTGRSNAVVLLKG